MKIKKIHFVVILCLLAWQAQAIEDLPKPRGYVNDFAEVLDVSSGRRIEALCMELEQKTGAQMALVTLKSLEGGDIQDTANRLFEAWGIGQKGKDNGLLLLDAVEDRRIWIEVGYGLEGILPDGKVGGILDEYVIPYIQAGDRGSGYLAGLAAMATVVAADAGIVLDGAPKPQPLRQPSRSGRGVGGIIIPILFFLTMMFLMGRRRRGAGLWILPLFMLGGGGFGGGSFGGSFGGGFGGFGGGFSGGGGAGRGY